MMTIEIGVMFKIKSMNERLAAEPIRMLGGSPIRVAMPPMLEERISANRKG